MISERIKQLREQSNLTQVALAKRLGITRSSVNALEMGISVPSTQYVTELAGIFRVSTDHLLGVEATASVDVTGLTDADITLVCSLIAHLREKNRKEPDTFGTHSLTEQRAF